MDNTGYTCPYCYKKKIVYKSIAWYQKHLWKIHRMWV